ncbi:efflux RND transporter periplasmic adaptor subunit [Sporomusa aerivorans]|uniref:efflux RND transporter periplasmic adaptor subunit n=1 Tax=Sporomusa aerivorans TaxID=204936 RepID=UPI00352BB46E
MKKAMCCWVLLGGVIAIAAILAAGCSQQQAAMEQPPLVRSQVVRLEQNSQGAIYSGEVRGRYEKQLSFQVSGKVIRRNVELGSVVNPGDILLEIDARDIVQTVNAGAAQVYSAESQLKLAENNLKRYQELYEQQAISRTQYEQYQNAYDAALAAVQQTSAQYAQGSNQLGYSSLAADCAGIIAAVNVEAGQVVSAGQTVLTLVQAGEQEVEIYIPEHRIEELRKAASVQITFWALPGAKVEGAIREVAPVADKATRTYKVRISLKNPPPEVKLGMTATVTAAGTSAAQKAAYIPLAALYQSGDTPQVWVVNNGAVGLKPVKTGAVADDKVQVLGLAEGEIIVTAGVHKLSPGQIVRTAGDRP